MLQDIFPPPPPQPQTIPEHNLGLESASVLIARITPAGIRILYPSRPLNILTLWSFFWLGDKSQG